MTIKTRTVLALIAAGLITAACQEEDSDEGADATSDPATTEAPAETEPTD